ncbi:NUDIX domain-containing protein [Anaerococcus porci]|uniref:NUDIX domain-containing protein n=1 Tax=Anaerococcus porci TaxID=2652269 RepID=A0A6N7VTD6_9FIRM|nr:NUDIX domain-containing protein [Anaerococcus porci]MDY3005976.1 NUDIX domain-containing protein [Anaerococcus porci]MSS77087.1 NUDIX domain-containing protein [Anaerococcus porci]
MIEYVDLYDNFRNKTGDIIERRQRVPNGLYRLIIHVCIFDTKGKMLIQQRTSNKSSWANMWDLTISGAVSSGETSQIAANRELFEELGIEYDFSKDYPNLSVKTKFRIDDIFIINNMKLGLDSLILQKEEVKDASFKTLDEILSLIDKKEFVPYQKDYIKLLFYLKDNNNLFDMR